MIQNVPLLGCSPVRLSTGGGSDALLQSFSSSTSSKVTKAGCDGDWNGVYIMLYDHNYCPANVIFQTIKMMNHLKSRSIGL